MEEAFPVINNITIEKWRLVYEENEKLTCLYRSENLLPPTQMIHVNRIQGQEFLSIDKDFKNKIMKIEDKYWENHTVIIANCGQDRIGKTTTLNHIMKGFNNDEECVEFECSKEPNSNSINIESKLNYKGWSESDPVGVQVSIRFFSSCSSVLLIFMDFEGLRKEFRNRIYSELLMMFALKVSNRICYHVDASKNHINYEELVYFHLIDKKLDKSKEEGSDKKILYWILRDSSVKYIKNGLEMPSNNILQESLEALSKLEKYGFEEVRDAASHILHKYKYYCYKLPKSFFINEKGLSCESSEYLKAVKLITEELHNFNSSKNIKSSQQFLSFLDSIKDSVNIEYGAKDLYVTQPSEIIKTTNITKDYNNLVNQKNLMYSFEPNTSNYSHDHGSYSSSKDFMNHLQTDILNQHSTPDPIISHNFTTHKKVSRFPQTPCCSAPR